VVGFTSDSEAAIREIVTLSPDLVLIDTKMNGAKHVRLGWRVISWK